MSYDFLRLASTHDLSLPDWGPYSKKLFGISHLADPQHGTRFDFAVVPAQYRRALAIPDALRPSGYLPWQTAPDLSAYSYRQQIEWRDRLYADISFCPAGQSAAFQHSRLVRCILANRTELAADLALHFLCRLEFAAPLRVEAAADQPAAKPNVCGAQRGVIFDALHHREVRMDDATGGSAYEIRPGDQINFHFRLRRGQPRKYLFLRQKPVDGGQPWKFSKHPLRRYTQNEFTVTIEWPAEGKISYLDCALLSDGPEPEMRTVIGDATPIFTDDPETGNTFIRYPGVATCYGIHRMFAANFIRHYAVDDLMHTLRYDDGVHQHYMNDFRRGSGKEQALAIVYQPIAVPAGATRTAELLLTAGTEKEVKAALQTFAAVRPAVLAAAAKRNKKTMVAFPEKGPGGGFAFSQEKMTAVVLSNVVYPTRFKDEFARHHTPGRQWNSLYTWDSGFIGLGLLEIDIQRAVENLNAYLTGDDDQENAFILHGTPLPVQLYLLYSLWNRTRDRKLLAYFYPRARRFYEYLAGRHPGSTTRTHSREALICTWDYFYNSGGWDDYPPQLAFHQARRDNSNAPDVIPAVGSSHLIRSAKMLRALARILRRPAEEIALYDHDIAEIGAALQRYSWDADAGYFSYVLHDAAKTPVGFYRCLDGTNFNLGLDGASPLIAGICTPKQQKILWDKLMSPAHCWSRVGICAVDQSAPYYRTDGYWNGTVWFPHQWFFWMAALNDGRSDFAWKIAQTALRLWEQETQASYNCYEQFAICSGRGAGWHHFSGLSSPVLCWYGAYYREKRLTAGYDVCIRAMRWRGGRLTAELYIDGEDSGMTTVVLTGPRTAGSSRQWAGRAEYAGKKVALRRRHAYCVEVSLPKNTRGKLVVE